MDRLPDVSWPRVPSGARRLFINYMICNFSILLFGAALSISGALSGSVPPWVGWVIVACLLLPLLWWQGVMFIRLGMLTQQAKAEASAAGFWSLTRGDLRVGGLLVLSDPSDADQFAYKINVSLSEDSGHASVSTIESEHLDE